VAVTANVTAADRTRCLDAGMDDFIAKPIQLQSLANVLARYLRAA
jgi:CheY-like chemotaxis protein